MTHIIHALFFIFLFRSKTETKEGTFKSIQLAPAVVVSAPVFNAAKPAGMFGPGEPDGFVVSVTEAGKPSLDLKVHNQLAVCVFFYSKPSGCFLISLFCQPLFFFK